MRIGNIPTINRWFLVHTREWECRWHLGMDQVQSTTAFSVTSFIPLWYKECWCVHTKRLWCYWKDSIQIVVDSQDKDSRYRTIINVKYFTLPVICSTKNVYSFLCVTLYLMVFRKYNSTELALVLTTYSLHVMVSDNIILWRHQTYNI